MLNKSDRYNLYFNHLQLSTFFILSLINSIILLADKRGRAPARGGGRRSSRYSEYTEADSESESESDTYSDTYSSSEDEEYGRRGGARGGPPRPPRPALLLRFASASPRITG